MSNTATGIFESNGRSGGFLRSAEKNYRIDQQDVFVPADLIRAINLRGGEAISFSGKLTSGKKGSKVLSKDNIELINDQLIDDFLENKPFLDLIPISPDRAVHFETDGGPTTTRIVDLLTPIGFGQRGLIVAPPRTGKTVLLQQMAAGVSANHPEVYMMVLLIDERPEEVTDMRRTVRGEVVASSNDQNIASHVRIARLMIEKARRMVESGKDVFVLLDSLTRLGRAFNADIRGSGRIMSGGLDIRALNEPKSIFGAARNIENGGSLTIIASALIDTGSRMDEVIFNEFKGTGNMEIVLCRELANKRIWPAIDLEASGTRQEERLLTPGALELSYKLRRSLSGKGAEQSMIMLLELMQKYPDGASFISGMADRVIR